MCDWTIWWRRYMQIDCIEMICGTVSHKNKIYANLNEVQKISIYFLFVYPIPVDANRIAAIKTKSNKEKQSIHAKFDHCDQ